MSIFKQDFGARERCGIYGASLDEAQCVATCDGVTDYTLGQRIFDWFMEKRWTLLHLRHPYWPICKFVKKHITPNLPVDTRVVFSITNANADWRIDLTDIRFMKRVGDHIYSGMEDWDAKDKISWVNAVYNRMLTNGYGKDADRLKIN